MPGKRRRNRSRSRTSSRPTRRTAHGASTTARSAALAARPRHCCRCRDQCTPGIRCRSREPAFTDLRTARRHEKSASDTELRSTVRLSESRRRVLFRVIGFCNDRGCGRSLTGKRIHQDCRRRKIVDTLTVRFLKNLRFL